MQEGVVVQAADGRITSANAAAERILGLSREQLLGRDSMDPRWRSIRADGSPFPGSEHPAMVTLRTGEAMSQVIMGVHQPSGALSWLSINSQPIRDAEGNVAAVVVTFSDVTESRQQAAALAARERQFALVLEGSNDGFWDWHIPTGRVTFSDRWLAMLGYQEGEIEPHVSSWERLVHPDDLAMVRKVLEEHLRNERPLYETEHRARHKDGRWLWILDRGKVVERDAEGNPVRAAGTHTDITPRREIEVRLRRALLEKDQVVEELQRALRSVKTLSGLLPVCAWCKNVRDDRGYWQKIEQYLAEHTEARFTHGLCPDCSKQMLPSS